MIYRILVSISLLFPALTIAEELELVCVEENSQNRKYEIYVLYENEGESYAYVDGQKYGFGFDFWERETISENRRNEYAAVFLSDELVFSKHYDTLENEEWETVDAEEIIINRITGNFERTNFEGVLSKGQCQPSKVKKL